jgi:hypothetical protein
MRVGFERRKSPATLTTTDPLSHLFLCRCTRNRLNKSGFKLTPAPCDTRDGEQTPLLPHPRLRCPDYWVGDGDSTDGRQIMAATIPHTQTHIHLVEAQGDKEVDCRCSSPAGGCNSRTPTTEQNVFRSVVVFFISIPCDPLLRQQPYITAIRMQHPNCLIVQSIAHMLQQQRATCTQ